jgi:hypothetical protein
LNTCTAAVDGGGWRRRVGTSLCSREAAGGGHLAVLQWARANGCDWNQEICLEVAPAGSEMREWIQAQPA